MLCTPAEPPKAESPKADQGFLQQMADKATNVAASVASPAVQEKMAQVRERGGSYLDMAKEGAVKREEESKEETFADFATKLVKLPKYDFVEYRANLDEAMTKRDNMGYFMKAKMKFDTMRGGSNEQLYESYIAEVKQHLAIIDHMTPCEISRPGLVRYAERKRIEQALGIEPTKDGKDMIKDVLNRQSMLAMQHEWCVREHEAGRPLPQTNDEFQYRLRLRPTAQAHKLIMEYQRRSMTAKDKMQIPLYNGKRRKKLFTKNNFRRNSKTPRTRLSRMGAARARA